MKLLMIRHGEIKSNTEKIYAGRSSEGLTERGICQVNEVAEKLTHYDVHSIYTSSIERAVQTTEIIGKRLGRGCLVEKAFRELELGPWEGMYENDIALKYPEEWSTWNQRPAELKMPGRETLLELQERVLEGVRNIFTKKPDSNVVIITHVAIIRVFMLWYTNKSLNLYKKMHVPNAEIFEFKVDNLS